MDSFLEENGKFYQGGNAKILHTLLKIDSGDELLYVGDHVFADVMRSKRSVGWRTCLIVPELVTEIATYKRMRMTREELYELRKHQYLLETEIDRLRNVIYKKRGLVYSEGKLSGKFEEEAVRDKLLADLSLLRATIRTKLSLYDKSFHPRWGQLFKAGFQESRIAKQVLKSTIALKLVG